MGERMNTVTHERRNCDQKWEKERGEKGKKKKKKRNKEWRKETEEAAYRVSSSAYSELAYSLELG